ncbi:MAG: hypothetical protein PCFJNLEI_01858 [Verrucomicrobiae bacterium]|nr:hypothetical protein [Verrucomicrobiae bacterium]
MIHHIKHLLGCGQCLSPLEERGDSLHCPRCASTHPVRNGVINLAAGGPREFQEITIDMEAFLADARQRGWKSAFPDLLQRLSPTHRDYMRQYVLDKRRSAWRFLANLVPTGVAVDFGCGWGANATGLAQNFGTVFAFDLSATRLEATLLRSRASGLTNLVPLLAGDTPKLPLASESVDLFALNGVLEYIGQFREGEPRACQRAFLQEVWRVLKPTGQVYVGIENRYGWPFFLGARDHPGTKYTSFLPRWLANRICQAQKNEPYRIYTYGYRASQKLLTEAGFAKVEMYAPYPHYSEFHLILPLNRPTAIRWAFQPHSRKRRAAQAVLSRVNLLKHFTHCFTIIASKDPSSGSFVAEVGGLVPASARSARPFYVEIPRNDKVIIHLSSGAKGPATHLGLLSLTPREAERLSASAASLQQVHAIPGLPDAVRHLIPTLVSHGTHQGQPYFIQTCAKGAPALRHLRETTFRTQCLDNAVHLLVTLGQATSQRRPCDEALFARLVSTPLQAIANRYPEQLTPARCTRFINFARGRWLERAVPLVVAHGDFGLQHIFVEHPNPTITGVIDWETLRIGDYPMGDLLNLLVLSKLELGSDNHAAATLTTIDEIRTNTAERAWVTQYVDALSLPAGTTQIAAVLYLLRFLEVMQEHGEDRCAPVVEQLGSTVDHILSATNLP